MTTFKDFKDILAEEKITPEVDNYMFSTVLTRKPTNFVDLGNALPINKMPADVQKFIKSLKMITWKDLYGSDPVKDYEFWKPHKGIFRMKTPQWFKVKAGKKIILIDNEGHDYPRYAAWIK
jgi:hypothetical protein